MIPYGRQHIDADDIRAVVEVLEGGALTQGPKVDAFEEAIRSYVGAKYAVAMASGTAGLHLAALAAGVGPGNALVTSPITFVASSNAALYAGGSPLFADVDPGSVNMSPASLRDVLRQNKNVRAIVPVHFGGLPCDMEAIKAAADAAGAIVIEDAAHALGATYADGTRVGNCRYSAMTMFSFHPVKAIAAGEGGMITTNDEALYRRLLRLRSHGINKLDDPLEMPAQAATEGVGNLWYYEMQELGFHYRITDIQCALATSQLSKIDKFLARRRALVHAYDEAFAHLKNARPAQSERQRSGHHLYVLRIDFKEIGTTRAVLMKELRARDIITQVHYIPVPAHPFYRKLGFEPEDYPNAQRYYEEGLTIPLFYDLTDAQQRHVIASVEELVR
ncbi:MAG TPA: UDP-4-amino-4,6-dideoxy-N-acetyl-beta-L-altrosamine transaminase [Gemmatimonadaceae bacterium]|nr:UDP-4-amino-4,6-dideoxy-N-acetyl-beta-L-altrosamine transaminase [Gemmatimonadaceae bacterium]